MPWVAIIFFWIAALGVFHIYIGYPLLIRALARLCGEAVKKGSVTDQASVVIAAYNEAATLPGKLKSVLSGANGARVAEVLIGSDGSTDGTESAVETLGDSRIRVVRFDVRRGKPAVLNDLIPQCVSDVVILTDARQDWSEGAASALLSNFADPRVGVASGELIFRDPDSTGSATAKGMDFYWRYEKFIRKAEAAFRSVPGATGALYAIRKSLFRPIDPELLLDDVAIPMLAITGGYRCVFEEQAVVYDVPSKSGREESVRKRRTIAGNAQLVQSYPFLLLPWRNPIWFEFISHKMLRLLSPFLLILCLLTSTFLITMPFYAALWLVQVLFYGLALAGFPERGEQQQRPIWLAAPAMFVRLNWTTALSWLDILQRRYTVSWQRAYAE